MKYLLTLLLSAIVTVASYPQSYEVECQAFKIENSKFSDCSPVDINITIDHEEATVIIDSTTYVIYDSVHIGSGNMRLKAQYDNRNFTITWNLNAKSLIISENKSPLMMVYFKLK